MVGSPASFLSAISTPHSSVGAACGSSPHLLVKKFKEFPDFCLTFKPCDLTNSGILVIADASLGNVTRRGNVGEDPFARVCSQSAYYGLVADEKEMKGEQGNFAVLDARSHRISRMC